MPITVTTWNVENFSSASPAFQAKLNHLATVLAQLNPDVVALQEILDAQALNALANQLGYQPIAAPPDSRGNRVAFLLRLPPINPVNVTAWRLPATLGVHDLGPNNTVVPVPVLPRPALQVDVAHNGKVLTFINAHLKSKLLSYPGNRFNPNNETERVIAAHCALERRASEALTLREHATALLAAGRPTILLGDFNDGPEAATTQVLYGPEGSQPRGPQDGANAASGFHRADAGDAQRLFNVAKLMPEDQRWTRMHNGQKELIDHILASEHFMPKAGNLRTVPALSIINADSTSVGNTPRTGEAVPDHAPATATFQI